ncbi:hypothetical protein SAMN05660653_01868 [Desulfonatronum thiosulfatophilum]|uniref:Uncharacterized protein n=2 Tax=Desulfonatronum thiosulfatophilum TaxID=617002 RepID=A0A1G6D2V0_9BACT|nr:hypothetical protein SAMN05660653_01868 [Desulfonatronum thiosulfatophilum]
MNFQVLQNRLYFDKKDYELLGIVNDVLDREDTPNLKSLLTPYLHPHGIKEMAASKGLRIAYAVVRLFRSLERSNVDERLRTLSALREEVFSSSGVGLRNNTARVLLQIMKELVRAKDEEQKLKLARDFREAATGRPRAIARQLRKYHLVEMPEEWNQIAFDDHVHDANTKGRKTATHLIMDAWIKGIRRLRVIYYNYLTPEVADELMRAAAIMDVDVRVGLEFTPRFRGRYIRLIWSPRGFNESSDYLDFCRQPGVQQFMDEGRAASEYKQAYVFAVMEAFNQKHRLEINRRFGILMPLLSRDELLHLVGTGQPSLHHLAKLIHDKILPLFRERLDDLHECCAYGGEEQRQAGTQLAETMNRFDIENIIEEFLRPSRNPDLPNLAVPSDDDDAPALLRASLQELLDKLERLHARYRITLGLSGLWAEDVLEILYQSQGRVTRLEAFNFKDTAYNRCPDNTRIFELQSALNSGNAVSLKRVVMDIVQKVVADPDRSEDQKIRLRSILSDLETFRDYYRGSVLESRIGTDSTGGSSKVPGMGLVVVDTLPWRCRRQMNKLGDLQGGIPIRIDVVLRKTYDFRHFERKMNRMSGTGQPCIWSRIIPWLCPSNDEWQVQQYQSVPSEHSNIRILGGFADANGNRLELDCTVQPKVKKRPHPRYLNTNIKNWLKILCGFVPAFATFALTKDWWLLAYFGALIWFGITGVRNIIQSVLGGGGLRRTPFLRWSEYVKWNRISDSLMYTGFSVPLLDFLVKTVALEQGMGVTVATAPLTLYAVMAVVNGLYLASHNLFRGLPKTAAVGNLFRTILSIPVALALNFLLGFALASAGVPAVGAVLQSWAAIISKLASDIVAGFIEGLADRGVNFRERARDYTQKLRQIFDVYARLELQHPDSEVLSVLETPERFVCSVSLEEESLNLAAIVNALDLMYFWMYQPRARHVLEQMMRQMSTEERRVFLLSQYVLQRERDISQLFLDGLVGKNFAGALAFYLHNWRRYLEDIQRLALHLPSFSIPVPKPRRTQCRV